MVSRKTALKPLSRRGSKVKRLNQSVKRPVVTLKPLKFTLSVAIYSGSLALIVRHVDVWPGLLRVASRVVAWGLWVEMAIIYLQAARGTTSHFNEATPFDTALFRVMGVVIVVVTLASAAIAAALFRHRFADRALGWSVRLGLTLSIAGAFLGGAMVAVSAHTVGAPDGGPGLPATNWSTEHGDLRIPHFLGLHAMQALPLLALWFKRQRLPEAAQVRLVTAAAGSYALLFGILLQQALRGQPLIHPDTWTLGALAGWATLTAACAWAAANGRQLARA